ncbi:hypothetical protein BP5796_12276 [Coleophoma crateriformis]|uniref:Nephrocystin 3-like N-terminal domain-containing protein n=1 Tax=Coleophoma crateriformis TaxID=565419 RepID=A0A3D8Q947_9HELO|nr:hypothetical protein BP5796_12276 [Coleophoma crateriformis]
MAEALGIAGSVAGLVQLSIAVYQGITKFCREAKDASFSVSQVATQTRNLAGVLQNLSLLSTSLELEGDNSSTSFQATYIDACFTTLRKVESRLQEAQDDFKSGKKSRIIVRSLKWPFSTDETKSLLGELGEHRNNLELALSADTARRLRECLSDTNSLKHSIDKLQVKIDRKIEIDTRVQLTKKRRKIVDFFLKVNPEPSFKTSQGLRMAETGKWLTERDAAFRNWMDVPGSKLWLSGIPGAGKTILAGAVIDETLQKQSTSTGIGYFFCDYKVPESQKTVNVLSALAVQLAKQATSAFKLLEAYYERLNPEHGLARNPEADELVKLVEKILSLYVHVYLVIDGLDECGEHVVEVVQSLKSLTTQPQTSIALFSRKEDDIRDELAAEYEPIEIAAHTEDLELYVLAEMEKRKSLKNLGLKHPDFHKHIRQTLVEGANGMFRWVACQLDHLSDLPNNTMRRNALTELPPTLFETYDRILDRVLQCPKSVQNVTRKALHWVGLGYPNLNVPALCEAVSIPDDIDILHEDDQVEIHEITRRCSSLIRLSHDSERFEYAHFTVKEYLQSLVMEPKRGFFRFEEDKAVQSLLITSLRFLTFSIFDQKPSPSPTEIKKMERRNEEHPFYSFAGSYVFGIGRHPKGVIFTNSFALILENEKVMKYARDLFHPRKSNTFLSWVLNFVLQSNQSRKEGDSMFADAIGIVLDRQFSTLHVAAMLALPTLCEYLLKSGEDVNVSCRLGSPLISLLIGIDLLFNIIYMNEYIPHIHCRRIYGGGEQEENVLTILLSAGADTSLKWHDTSILRLALGHYFQNHERPWILPLLSPTTVVEDDALEQLKIILGEAILKTECGATEIANAILAKHSESNSSRQWSRLQSIVRRCAMDQKVDLNKDFEVFAASTISDEEFPIVVKIAAEQNLIEEMMALVKDRRFSNSDLRFDPGGVTPLHVAARCGSATVVGILLEIEVDRSIDGLHSQHVLHDRNCEATTFPNRSQSNDNIRDDADNTVWHAAAEGGSVDVLEVLLENTDDLAIPLAVTSQQGRTPLACAIHEGNLDASLLLLQHCDVNSGHFQSDYPLLNEAVSLGSEKLFRALHGQLKNCNANSNASDESRPLHNIRPSCPPDFVDYLVSIFDIADTTHDGESSFELMLLGLKFESENPYKWPERHQLEHNIVALLPDSHELTSARRVKHAWEIFCESVLSKLTVEYDPEDTEKCDPIVSTVHILIDRGVLASYETKCHQSGYRPLFRGLLRQSQLGSEWRYKWITKIVDITLRKIRFTEDIKKDAVCTDLLARAITKHNVSLVEMLLDYGVDVHQANKDRSPIEQACFSSTLQIFRRVVDHSDHSLLDRPGHSGAFLLQLILKGPTRNKTDRVKELVKRGAKLDIVANDRFATPTVVMAAKLGYFDTLHYMLAQGADSLLRSNAGWSILHEVAWRGNTQILEDLRRLQPPLAFWSQSCNIIIDTPSGPIGMDSTATHISAVQGHVGFLKRLISLAIVNNVNNATRCNTTPLHQASWRGHLKMVKFLISNGANVNSQRSNGWLPLDCALDGSHFEVAKVLLDSGSHKPAYLSLSETDLRKLFPEGTDLTVTGSSITRHLGAIKSPAICLESAILSGNHGLCQRIIQDGCSVDVKMPNCQPCSSLVRAITADKPKIVDLLLSKGAKAENISCSSFHPVFGTIAALATHFLSSTDSLERVLSRALDSHISWYGSGLSPLHIAVLDGKIERLRLLLSHIRNNSETYRQVIGENLTIYPIDDGWLSRSVMSLLINELSQSFSAQAGVPWDLKGYFVSATPMHFAIIRRDLAAVKLLLAYEAEVDAIDLDGRTPLILAAD